MSRLPVTRRGFGAGLAAGALVAGTGIPRPARAAATHPLRVAYGAIGPNRHPHMLANVPDRDIANVMFDPLLTLAPDGSVVPVVAERYETVSSTRWRFHLHQGITFHDGRPLQAPDVKFSLELYLKPEVPNSYLYNGWLDHVDVIDDYTVEVVAKQPYRVALANMAYLSHIIPRASTRFRRLRAETHRQRPIQTGAIRGQQPRGDHRERQILGQQAEADRHHLP